jgi:MFS family permease
MAKKKPPILNNTLKLFLVAMILANIAGQMYGPILPLYLKDLKASVLQVGVFFTIYQIIPLVLQVLGGWISDNLGRLRSIAIGSLLGILSYVGLIWAPTWQWVLLGEGLAAVTRSLVSPSFGAFIADQSAEENRARVFGVVEMIYGVVGVIGPALGGWLAGTYGFKPMLLAAAVFYFLATLIRVAMARTAANGKESAPNRLSVANLKQNLGGMLGLVLAGGVITCLLLTDGVRDVAFSMSFTLMPLYMDQFGKITVQQIGLLNAAFSVAAMVTNLPGGWLADKKGERVAIALGFLFEFAALMVFINTTSFWGYGLSFAVMGLGVGLMSPAYSSLITKAIPEKMRGTGMGLLQSSLGVFSLPSPAIGAELYTRYNPKLPFTITAWVALATIIPAWTRFRMPKENRAVPVVGEAD